MEKQRHSLYCNLLSSEILGKRRRPRLDTAGSVFSFQDALFTDNTT